MPIWPDGGGDSVLPSALQWVVGVLYGPLGTTIAVIAIAMLGALMLAGRLPMRRGVQMVLALFLFFGGASVAIFLVVQVPAADTGTASEHVAVAPRGSEKIDVFDPHSGISTVKP